MLRRINQLLVALSITLLTLVVLDALLPGFALSNIRSALLGIVVLGVLNSIFLPIAIRFTLPFDFLTFGLLPLVMNGLTILLVSRLVPGFEVHDVITGILISFGLMFNNMLITGSYVFRKQRDRLEYAELARLARQRDASEVSHTPGLILLEIDGLAEPLLRKAIEKGYMPTLATWLKRGTHRLARWETSLPSQTSSMQAGILHGSHHDIPGFRFYDRNRKLLMVSNNPGTADAIIQPLLNGQGLLHTQGYSLNNWTTGDAPEVLLTFTAMKQELVKQADQLYAFFARAYNVQRVIVSMIWDIVVEVMEAQEQKFHNVLPRIERRFPYPLVRAATTRLIPYLSCQLLVSKLFEGIEAAYTTFLNYDEVAHHSGIDRIDAMRVLRQLDEQIRFITGAGKITPRPYEFIVLSDHGQSMGATFRQRYGKTLAELVDSLIGEGNVSLTSSSPSAEGIDHVSLLLSSLVKSDNRRAGMLQRALRKEISDEGRVELRQQPKPASLTEGGQAAKTVVCASGNLAHLYFADYDESLTVEKIEADCPGLTKALIDHPGISFIAVRTAQRGPIAIGKQGTYFLDTGKVEGENPFRDFGEHDPEHMKELMTYPHSGDIVVNSLYDPQTGEVAAFEELVGSHGGLGGTQNQPFILYPTALQPGELPELVGAPSVYRLLASWQAKLKEDGYKATQLPTPPPDIATGERSRSVSALAVVMAVIGTWNLLVGVGSLVASQGFIGPNAESIGHFIVPLVAALLSASIAVGLWRLRRWALEAAIAICAVSIILSVLDLLLAPPQDRGLGGILASIPLINTVLFAYLLYSNQVRRAFGYGRDS
jgi:uncharacterized membrane protein YvlD (DUF360 family)